MRNQPRPARRVIHLPGGVDHGMADFGLGTFWFWTLKTFLPRLPAPIRARLFRAGPQRAISPRRFRVSEFIRIGLWRASVGVDRVYAGFEG